LRRPGLASLMPSLNSGDDRKVRHIVRARKAGTFGRLMRPLKRDCPLLRQYEY
jgi:hypothetical protein